MLWQFLISSALRSNNYEVTRVSVDIAEYKVQRASRLSDKALEWVKKVKETGQPMDLRPMNASDRRTVHKLASEHGLTTESVGKGRDRHIVLSISEDAENKDDKDFSDDKHVE